MTPPNPPEPNPPEPNPLDPRRLAALLGNRDIRTAYAEIILGVDPALTRLSAKRRERAVAALLSAALIEAAGAELVATSIAFERLLATYPAREQPTGIQRFLRDGRIAQYPKSPDERRELLEWVARDAVGAEEVLSESEVNERLLEYTDEHVILRRYLVDHGLLLRTRSGSSYSRP